MQNKKVKLPEETSTITLTEYLAQNQAEVDTMTLTDGLAKLINDERGRLALLDFVRMFDQGAHGLDPQAWRAMELICQEMRKGGDPQCIYEARNRVLGINDSYNRDRGNKL